MKKLFGIAFVALPLIVGSVHAEGWPFNIQAGGNFYIKGGPGPRWPQAGPWYLYWPLEAHFVAPAPTGYPYWPSPQGLPNISIGGPACPPPNYALQPGYAPQPIVTMPATTPSTPAAPAPQATTPTGPKLQFPPYLQPTSYHPLGSSGQPAYYNPTVYTGQPPSYWYDR